MDAIPPSTGPRLQTIAAAPDAAPDPVPRAQTGPRIVADPTPLPPPDPQTSLHANRRFVAESPGADLRTRLERRLPELRAAEPPSLMQNLSRIWDDASPLPLIEQLRRSGLAVFAPTQLEVERSGARLDVSEALVGATKGAANVGADLGNLALFFTGSDLRIPNFELSEQEEVGAGMFEALSATTGLAGAAALTTRMVARSSDEVLGTILSTARSLDEIETGLLDAGFEPASYRGNNNFRVFMNDDYVVKLHADPDYVRRIGQETRRLRVALDDEIVTETRIADPNVIVQQRIGGGMMTHARTPGAYDRGVSNFGELLDRAQRAAEGQGMRIDPNILNVHVDETGEILGWFDPIY